MLLDKLEAIKNRFDDVERELSSSEATKDMKRYTQLSREYKEMKAVVEKYHEYSMLSSNLNNARNVLNNEKDNEFKRWQGLKWMN